MSNIEGLVIQYNVTDAAIAEIAEEFKNAVATTPDGYRNVVTGIRTTRDLRGNVEKRRVELKADALAFGKRVDGEANRIKQALFNIETPLKLLKEAVDKEKAAKKKAIEDARLKEERKKLEEERAEKEAEAKKVREAEQARLDEERKKILLERAELEQQQKIQEGIEKVQREEFERKEAAHAKRLEAENAERQRKQDLEDQERAQRVAKEERELAERIAEEERLLANRKAEQDRLDIEQEARDKAEAKQKQDAHDANELEIKRLEQEKRRRAALPDVEKLRDWVLEVLAVEQPTMVSPEGIAVLGQIDRKLVEGEGILEDFEEELKR